jgi:hypothetical protein
MLVDITGKNEKMKKSLFLYDHQPEVRGTKQDILIV